MTKQQRIIIFLLASINFTHILDFMIMMPLGNNLMPYFKISPQQFSLIVASYNYAAFASAFAAMFFVDRFDRKHILTFGYTGFMLGTLCCGIAPTHQLLLASRILAGLFGGIIGAQVLSIVADSFTYQKRGQAMGYLFSAFSLASVVGVPLGLFLAGKFSWHAPFFFIVALGVIITPCIYFFLPNMNKHLQPDNPKINVVAVLKQVVNKRINLLAFALSATLFMGHFVIIPFLNPFMEHNVGFNELQRNLVYIVGGLATMISAPLGGKLADKFGKHKVFLWFAFLSLIPILVITNLGVTPYYFALIATGIWFVLASGRNIPAQAIVSNVVPPEERGSFQSFNSCISSLAVGTASFISGLIVTKGSDGKLIHYPVVGYISVAIILLAVFISTKIPKQA
jgi:predicted MFS family arabinose efflux permease